MTNQAPTSMKALRVHSYGEPPDVLVLDDADVPAPGENRIRIRVEACALNPADWAVCMGFLPLPPPRGIGFDVSGIVDAVGDGVTTVSIGDRVFGVPDYLGYPSAGAAQYTVLGVWNAVPHGLDLVEAAALPMVVETAVRAIDVLGLKAGQTILVNGAGAMTGFAAVQIALQRGANVIATAGETYASRLRELGASVTSYGDGMVERIREIAHGAPDFALLTAVHSAQNPNTLRDLIAIVDGDPQRVMSISNFDEEKLGVRTTGREAGVVHRYDALLHYAQLAADRRFSVPIARTFALNDWREAMNLSLSGNAHGKLVLLPNP